MNRRQVSDELFRLQEEIIKLRARCTLLEVQHNTTRKMLGVVAVAAHNGTDVLDALEKMCDGPGRA